MKKRIALLFGGQSEEHEISLYSSVNIIKAINKKKYDLILIGIDKLGRWILFEERNYLMNPNNINKIHLLPTNNFLALIPGKNKNQLIIISTGEKLSNIDLIFPILHGSYGENGTIQGLIKTLDIPFIGSDVLGSAICMDKDITKRILRDIGVPVIPSITLFHHYNMSIFNFNYISTCLGIPLFIKPVNQGSSIGISKVSDKNSFNKALTLAFNYSQKIIIEQAILNSREIEIAMLGYHNNPEISVFGEIITNRNFYDYHAKYIDHNQTTLVIPVNLNKHLKNSIHKIARKAYSILNCNIMARMDFFLTSNGKFFLNEVNTIPGFTATSMYLNLWKACGLTYAALIERLIKLTLKEK